MILDVSVHRGFFYLVLKNVGDEPAVKVVTKIAPKIIGPDGKTVINSLPIFSGVTFFAAGKEFRILVGSAASYFSAKQPTTITATITYSDQSGKSYSENMIHDLNIYLDLPHPPEKDEPHP